MLFWRETRIDINVNIRSDSGVDIEVKMGEIVVTRRGEDNLITSGIGSCIALILYDPKHKIGAIAHAMLPSSLPHLLRDPGRALQRRPSSITEYGMQDTRYIDIAIDEILKKMESLGTCRSDLEAKLVGGANMFSPIESDIGNDNVFSAKQKLKKEGINIVGECVGGTQGRSVEFSVASGIVTVKIKF